MRRFSPFPAANSALMLRSWRRGQSASSASKRCTTTCTISTGRGASSSTSWTSSRSGTAARSWNRKDASASAAFQAGGALFVIHQPVGEGGRASRYLRKHPEGVGTVVFDVEDIDRAFALLDERGGTFITDIQRFTDDDGGTLAMFSITTPFGDTTFRFIERRGYRGLFPGFVATPAPAAGGNRFGFERIDHLTSNFQTMKPALLWMQHVLGLEQLWEIAFHTNDVATGTAAGASTARACKSVVMWDPVSGVKFANNEPFRPVLQGIADQHLRRGQPGRRRPALGAGGDRHRRRGARAARARRRVHGDAGDLLRRAAGAARAHRRRSDRREHRRAARAGDPRRRQREGRVPAADLPEGGGGPRRTTARPGPFFFEIIQRKGDQGFGAGNFRALFEAIERDSSEASQMLDRMAAGEIPAKPHTALRDAAGRLRHEECLTRDGFDGPFTILYHAERPHTAAVATAGHGWEIPEAADDKPRPLARRHYRSQELPRRGGPPLDARVPLLFNADVVISIVHPDEADPTYFANGDGDDLFFVVEGGGVLRSALGDVAFGARDYVFVPKGLVHRFVPDDRPQVWLSIECAAGFGLPRQWRNEVGQLRMDAPYSHRDFRRPVFAGPRDEGLRDLVIKRGDAFHGFRYPPRAAGRRRVGRDGLPVGVPDPQLPAARRDGPPAADGARHVRDARAR